MEPSEVLVSVQNFLEVENIPLPILPPLNVNLGRPRHKLIAGLIRVSMRTDIKATQELLGHKTIF
jgi:hypothetical protein